MDNNHEKNRDPKGNIIIIPPKPNFPPVFPFPPVNKDKIVKIKSVVENEFVVVDSNNYLYATGKQVNKSGIFKLMMLSGGRVKIRQEKGKYIRVNRDDFLVADTDNDRATIFKLYKMEDKEYVLQAPNGYFVRVRDRDKALVARAENPGPRTILKFREID